MTERLADISARIDGIRDLGAVVNAMKGIAAARAHVARGQVAAVDSYAQIIATAMARVVAPKKTPSADKDHGKLGLLVFCAEQGFAGAFSERVLDSFSAIDAPETLFLIGTRGLSIATARGITPHWAEPLPSHTPNIPKLADKITTAIFRALGQGNFACLDVIFTGWKSGRPSLVRQRLFPVDLPDLELKSQERPLVQLPAATLLTTLGQDYFNAQVCKAALHAFAAENEARMEAMTSAGNQIAREMDEFQAKLRRVRQEAITAEIIELSTGAASTGKAR